MDRRTGVRESAAAARPDRARRRGAGSFRSSMPLPVRPAPSFRAYVLPPRSTVHAARMSGGYAFVKPVEAKMIGFERIVYPLRHPGSGPEIGRASWRESVCQYV